MANKEKREWKKSLEYTIQPFGTTAASSTLFQSGYFPRIVGRETALDLADVVYNAINRGLVAGLKASAAEEIATGIIDELYALLSEGASVKFADYFTVRLYLHGLSDEQGTLTDKNELGATFVAGKDYDLDLDDYSWHFVGSGLLPKIELVTNGAAGAINGILNIGQNVVVVGKNLVTEEGATEVSLEDSTGAVVPLTTTLVTGDYLITCSWPSGQVATGKGYLLLKTAKGTYATKAVAVM